MLKRRTRRVFKITPIIFFGCLLFCQSSFAQNQSVGSGDWFNDANWLDNFGNNDHPTQGDNHEVHLSGGHLLQILAGNASTDGDLHIGDVGGGALGSGELHVLESGSLDVDGFLNIGGSAGTQNRLLVNTTGQVSGVLRVGQNSQTEAIVDLQNGTLTGSLQLGLLGQGRLNLSGGQFVGGNFNNPLGVFRGGLLNQTGGSLLVSSGVTEIESTGQYLLTGGTAEVNEMQLRGGIVDVSSTQPGGASLTVDGVFQNRSFLAGGLNDSGILRIGEGGNVTVDAGFIANDRSAMILMTGGTLAATGTIADLVVDDGKFVGSSGTVTAESDFLIQGGSNDQASTVEFSGDLQADISDTIAVGLSNNGNARLDIKDNASVETGGLQVGNLGNQAEFNLSGGSLISNSILAGNGATNTKVNLSGGITQVAGASVFGRTSNAEVNLSNDADILSTAQFELGQEAGVSGTLNMSNTANLETGQLIVGRRGTGIANLAEQSTTEATTIFAGVSEGGEGTISLTENATLKSSQSLILASSENSSGQVRVADNATLDVGGSMFMATNDVDSSARIDVFDDANVKVGGDLFAGNFQGEATINIDSLSGNAVFEVVGDANFGGTQSDTFVNVNDGEFKANNIFFDGFQPDLTSNRLELIDGKISTTNNLEFQRGVTAQLAGGTIEVGQDLIVGNNESAQSDSVIIEQNNSDVFVNRNFEIVADGETTYQILDGTLDVAGNANLGTGLSDNAGFGVLQQDGGQFSVAGDLTNLGLEHVHENGQLVVNGNLNVGDDNDETFASLHIAGGTVDVQNSVRVANDEFSISDGTLNVVNSIAVGSFTNPESFADFTIDGGFLQTGDFLLESIGSSSVSTNLNGGKLVSDRIRITATDDADAAFTQFGGELVTDEILTDGEFATFGILGGSLETRSQSLFVDGDLVIGGEGELKFKNGEIFDVTGSFVSFDASVFGDLDFPAGVLDLSQLDEIVGEDGFLPLIQVGDNTNLLSGDALDLIHLIEGFNAERFNELQFLAEFNGGTLNGRAFALAEGTTFGHEGSVGIAFANFSSVPEPGSCVILVTLLVAAASRRRRV